MITDKRQPENSELPFLMICGLLTGGLLGFKMNRKVVNHCYEILDQNGRMDKPE